MERIETTILRNLIFDEEYSRKVIPFIEPDYFENKTEKNNISRGNTIYCQV